MRKDDKFINLPGDKWFFLMRLCDKNTSNWIVKMYLISLKFKTFPSAWRKYFLWGFIARLRLNFTKIHLWSIYIFGNMRRGALRKVKLNIQRWNPRVIHSMWRVIINTCVMIIFINDIVYMARTALKKKSREPTTSMAFLEIYSEWLLFRLEKRLTFNTFCNRP